MKSADLHPGDRVEVNVRGRVFRATVRELGDGGVGIDPEEPKRITHRQVSIRQVTRKLRMQERLT